MNRIHRKIWSKRLGAYVAVAETARSCGKSSGVTGALLGAVLLGAAGLSLAGTVPVNTLPSGGAVVAGQAGISQAGNVLTVTQGSNKAAINWQSFSVGADAKVNFVQPSAQSVVLNQVLGADVSVIQGSINANGQVFLVNPSGVLFTPTAQVNVGALVASTQNISTADFMAGNYKFSGTSTASVENQGRITAANGGAVALIAVRVVNSGQINAPAGQVGLAAANTVTLDLGGPVLLRVSEGALNATIEQNGGIRADGGTIYLTAQAAGNLAASVINHSGVTQAQTLADVTGSIKLSADIVSHTGQLDASSATGRGGSIAVNAGTLIDAGTTTVSGALGGGSIAQTTDSLLQATAARLSADSRDGQGGRISLLGGAAAGGRAWLSGQVSATGVQGGDISASGNEVVAAGFQANSSGTEQAGRIRLGGGWQGKDSTLANAQTTRVGSDVQLSNQGASGTVVVWSDQQTTFGGHIDARRSAVEVSGKQNLSYAGTTQSASLLLDPKNITIGDPQQQLDMLAFRDPTQNGVGKFGNQFITLSNGNVVITAHEQNGYAGSVYMFSSTGALISTLAGNYSGLSGDFVGSGGVADLGNGNFVVTSPSWNIGRGAVTWVSGSTGLNGVVSTTNSLTGGHVYDSVGSGGVTVLSNGNYVVSSPLLGYNQVGNVGAVTWGNGTAGTTGVVTPSNSLLGTATDDHVGSGGVTALDNGGYVVLSPGWGAQRGAVTWVGNATTSGVTGTVSSSNSLVGQWSTDNAYGVFCEGDKVGSGGLIKLSNGKYLISSPVTNSAPPNPAYDSKTQLLTGALTWVDPAVGVTGVISSTNSLVGSIAGDKLGSGGIVEVGAAGSGNFVVASPWWHSGYRVYTTPDGSQTTYTPVSTGAVTFVNGSTGLAGSGTMTGLISSSNSLVEALATGIAGAGFGGVTALANGNYVVVSRSGATWADGNAGVSGVIDESNTLMIGSGLGLTPTSTATTRVLALSNGNYVVSNPYYSNAALGAVTWGSGTSGVAGAVSSSNSLLGGDGDMLGRGGVKEVGGSNYVVISPIWNNFAGAVTWGSGSAGLTGTVSSSNSIVGNVGEMIGSTGSTSTITFSPNGQGVTVLSNGNYVVTSLYWGNSKGAVTWGSGTSAVTGVVSSSNSLVGANSTYSNMVGSGGIFPLANGNYVVSSPLWGDGKGAATWGNGAGGTTGVVSSANSLVGSLWLDHISNGGVVALTNGNYVVVSPDARPNDGFQFGAVTWGNGQTGTSGVVSDRNSLVAQSMGDSVASGGVKALSNGNYVVLSPHWADPSADPYALRAELGAATWGNGNTGVSGLISSANSLVGSSSNDPLVDSFYAVGSAFAEVGRPGSGNYVVTSGGSKGGVTWGSGSAGVSGVVSSANSLVGNGGAGGLTVLPNGNYVIRSWGYADNSDMVTWADGNVATRGEVGVINSIPNLGHHASMAVINGQAWVKDSENGYVYRINGGVVNMPSDTVASATFANNPTADSTITSTVLKAMLDNGTAVTLQANNDITLKDALTVSANGHGGALTWLAGRNININAALTTDNGNFTAVAGSKNPDLVADNTVIGYPTLTIGPAGSINAGTGTVTMSTRFFDNQNTSSSTITSGLTNLFMPSMNVSGGWEYLKLGGLTQDGKRYNTSFNESTGVIACNTGVQCALPTSGFNVHYTNEVAVLTVTPAAGQTMTYGQDYTPGSYTLSGFIGDDTATTAGITGTANLAVGFNPSGGGKIRAGTYDVVYRSGLLSALGYRIQDGGDSNELQVLPAALSSISGITAANKTYNGTAAATLDVSHAVLNGTVSGDAVSLNTANASGSFADKNVGQDKVVTVNGLVLSGADAANYTTAGVTTTASIMPATITSISGITAASKTYDGTSAATLNTSAAVLQGKVSGDQLTLATSSGNFANKNVGQDKTVYVNDLSLGGADAGNYLLGSSTASTTTTASITPATISSISGLTGVDRIANGKTAVDLNSSAASFNGMVTGDQLTVGAYNANFADLLPAKNKPVSISALSLGGADAGNYTLAATTGSTTATMKPSSDPQSAGGTPPAGSPGGVPSALNGPINSNPGNTTPNSLPPADTNPVPPADTNPTPPADTNPTPPADTNPVPPADTNPLAPTDPNAEKKKKNP